MMTEETVTKHELLPPDIEEVSIEDDIEDVIAEALRAAHDERDTRLNELHETLNQVASEITTLRDQQRTANQSQVLLERISEENRRYREKYHEREVLRPVMRALIALGDRFERELHEYKQLGNARLNEKQIAAAAEYEKLAKSRKIDFIEVQATLSIFGVDSFTITGKQFDPAQQERIGSIATNDRRRDQRIARRCHCGYRRDGQIIRPERVYIYHYKENKQCT